MVNLRKQKKTEEIGEWFKTYKNFLILTLEKATHQQLETVRKNLANIGKVRVIKNSIYEKAFNKYFPFKKLAYNIRKNFFPLKNQNMIIFFQDKWIEGLQKINQLIKENFPLSYNFGVFDEAAYNKNSCLKIAQLPSKTVLYTQLISLLKSTVNRLVSSLTFNHKKILYCLNHQSKKVTS